MGKIKTVNSLSGGKTSSYMAVHYPADYEVFSLVCINDLESKPKDKSIIDYVNNKLGDKYISQFGEFIATAEDDKTLYAMRDLEQFLGREIIWVRGKDFDDVIDTKNTHGGCPTRLPSKQFRICTEEMKLVPIFHWWFNEIGEKCEMRIGFRFDEFYRIENFFNGKPNEFKIPISTRTYGQRLQQHENFTWRKCNFPVAKAGKLVTDIGEFWKDKGIDFPVISNCIMCFWKKEETLAAMSLIHPSKMNWAAGKEKIGKGTWQNTEHDYQYIIDNAKDLTKEVYIEILAGESCDSGGCNG